MNDSYQPENIIVSNERSLKKLIRSITNSQGHFTLILARCNYHSLREQIVQQLKAECQVEIREIYLSKSVKTLYTTIEANLGDQLPQALMIFGLELIEDIDQVLISTNQVREEFRKNFQFPIVIWVNDDIFQKLIRLIPDFKSWTGNSIKFKTTTNELLENLRQTTSSVFTAILTAGGSKFLDNDSLNLDFAALNLSEIKSVVSDLQIFQQQLEPELKASVQFLLGREADVRGHKSEARNYYEQSLAVWEQKIKNQKNTSSDDLKYYGCLLWHLGLWWRQFATLHIAEHHEAYLKAKNYFQKCVEVFQEHNYPDLAAKFINNWGEALTKLEAWNELENVASVAIKLHRTYPEPIRLAYSYGLMAEVALKKFQWVEAKQHAELALQTNDTSSSITNTSLGQTINWEWEKKYYHNLYLLLIAEAQKNLNQVIEAIANLETARRESNPQYDPLLYIRILATLRSIYFEQGNYLEAFEVKLEQRSIEQQYGLRAFVGAGRLQSRLQVINPVLAETEPKAAVTQEIAASGRMQDVHRLIERIGRPDHKLTVIYGQSGVGKSSLVQAGLLPALKERAIDARDVVPVLLQVYTDWTKVIGSRLVESLEEVRGLSFPLFLDSMASFIEELNKNVDKDLLTVLIFDQFEEFFFAYKDPTTRKPFFELISECLNVPYVKIILSLREDYLHYLLECNRLTPLDAIDRNILDKNNLYYLGNFSPEDARSVIQSLTQTSQLYLEPQLIDELEHRFSNQDEVADCSVV
ncbi:ATP-binding protein [Nostoc sp.]|uniref:ATP-binding protein n=1 Tax=Nostoc sp. TaxID=1180 RepID=UPI002FF6FF9E